MSTTSSLKKISKEQRTPNNVLDNPKIQERIWQVLLNHYPADLLEKLKSIKTLKKDWAWEASIPPSPAVINNVYHIFELLGKKRVTKLSPLDITPSPYGTINLEWEWINESFVSLEIGKEDLGFYGDLPDGTQFWYDNLPFDENHLPQELVAVLEEVCERKVT